MRRLMLILSSSVVLAQPIQAPQQSPQSQAGTPPVQVEMDLPADVKKTLQEQKELVQEQLRSEKKKVKRAQEQEDYQYNLYRLQVSKAIEIEKKRFKSLKNLPPYFYSIETAGIVGNYAISRGAGVLMEGYSIGNAKIVKISLVDGVKIKHDGYIYNAENVEMIKPALTQVYENAIQNVQSVQAPQFGFGGTPSFGRPQTFNQPPPVPPPPPPPPATTR